MNIIFFGSNEISGHFLKITSNSYKISLIITKPDKPAGRGLEIKESVTKKFGIINNIKVLTPVNLEDRCFLEELTAVKSDLGVVVSYGKLLPETVFSIPKHGCINVHFSLLPEYRGAAPIQWSLINGNKTTGVTVFFISDKLDSGKIILQKSLQILDTDDYFSLEKKLVESGIDCLLESISRIKEGKTAEFVTTDFNLRGTMGAKQVYAPALKKEDGRINWNKPATGICNLYRGLIKWPGIFTDAAGIKNIKIMKVSIIDEHKIPGYVDKEANVPGEIIGIIKNTGFAVKCGSGFVLIESVQPENKKAMPAWPFLQGYNLKTGDRFN